MRPARLPLRTVLIALALSLGLLAPAAQAAVTYYGVKANGAPTPPRDRNSLLYYRIGGSESSQRAPNPGTVSVKLGLSGLGRVNFSCGKFDAQITVQNLLNNLRGLGVQVTNAVQAGVAALPMYVFQRALPGLYELYQTYIVKAEKEWQIALKSCEEMESQMRQGQDPYEDYVKMAKGEAWKAEAASTQDAVQAKENVERKGLTDGMIWVGGVKAGGKDQKPISPVWETTVAGYNLQMNRPVLAAPTMTATTPQALRLTRAFPTAQSAADWAVSVLGDQNAATCSDSGCPTPGAINGVGLLPRLEAEVTLAASQLAPLANGSGVPSVAALEAAQAPGVAVSRELVEALRALPAADRAPVVARLAMEIAQARILDKALLVRSSMMVAASGVPEIERSRASVTLAAKIADLNRLIDDLLFDVRARREVVSQTAGTVIEAYRADQAVFDGGGTGRACRSAPLFGGKAQ